MPVCYQNYLRSRVVLLDCANSWQGDNRIAQLADPEYGYRPCPDYFGAQIRFRLLFNITNRTASK